MEYSNNVRVVLKNQNKDKIGTIFLEIVFIETATKRKFRRYINTGQRIHSDDIVRSKIKQLDRTKKVRQIIEKKKVETEDDLRNLELINGILTPEIYDKSITANPHSRKSVTELFDEFLKHVQKNYEYLTYKKHKTTKQLIEDYATQQKKSAYYLSDIDLKFFKGFTAFLKETKEHVPTTINKYQASLKTFMQFLTDELGLNQEEVHKGFKKTSNKIEGGSKVVLLKEHVQKLIDWKPTNKRFELVRDLFLFQIFTGIRYSDLINVNKSYVINNSLSFDMWKVPKRVTIPLHPKAMEILIKYDCNLGDKCKSLQNYNLDIKTVCQNAGLKDKFSSLNMKLSRKVKDDKPLYELVSTHVGRTTFITNCLIAGISPYIVIEYTGHQEIETLKYYMRLAGTMAKDAFEKFENYFDFKT